MNKVSRPFTLAALGLLTAVAGVCAQETGPSSRYSFYGWVQGGVMLNSRQPSDNLNFGSLFTDRANEPLLNQLVYTAERALAPEVGQADWGFKIQGMYGSDARFIHSLGLMDNVTNSILQPDLVEAFLNLHLPVVTAGGLDIKVGKFATLEGAETIDPRTNLFYSHSYIFNFGVPFHHTGVLAVVHVTEKLDLHFGVTRGVNSGVDDNNDSGAFHGGIGFKVMDGKMMGLLSTHIGPETPGNDDDYRYLNAFTILYTPTSQDTFITDLNYIQDDASGTKGYGVAQYYARKLNDRMTAKVRAEVWRDRDGFYVAQFAAHDDLINAQRGYPLLDPRTVGGGSTTYGGLTVGLDLRFAKLSNLVVRPELRVDRALRGNARPYLGSTRNTQFTAAVDLLLTF